MSNAIIAAPVIDLHQADDATVTDLDSLRNCGVQQWSLAFRPNLFYSGKSYFLTFRQEEQVFFTTDYELWIGQLFDNGRRCAT